MKLNRLMQPNNRYRLWLSNRMKKANVSEQSLVVHCCAFHTIHLSVTTINLSLQFIISSIVFHDFLFENSLNQLNVNIYIYIYRFVKLFYIYKIPFKNTGSQEGYKNVERITINLEKINVHTVLKYKYPSTFGVLCLHQGWSTKSIYVCTV
jgi:hypothetical protein